MYIYDDVVRSITFADNRTVLRDNVETYGTVRQATDDNMTNERCMLVN